MCDTWVYQTSNTGLPWALHIDKRVDMSIEYMLYQDNVNPHNCVTFESGPHDGFNTYADECFEFLAEHVRISENEEHAIIGALASLLILTD